MMDESILQLGFFGAVEEIDSKYRNDWITPPEVFSVIQFAGFDFDLDVAANHQNAKCKRYFTAQVNALTINWTVSEGKFWWCNPPFGELNEMQWFWKAKHEMLRGNEGIMLLPPNIDRPWFRQCLEEWGIRILFWPGRINFIDPTTQKRTSNTKGSMLAAFTLQDELPKVAGQSWWRAA